MKKVLLLSYRLGYDSLLYWDSILTSLGKKFNLKVIISAHPRSDVILLSKYYKGREVFTQRTNELVKRSEFCIAHYSTSINYAVLHEKPIIFITTNDIDRCDHMRKCIMAYVHYFNTSVLNISNDFHLPDINSINKKEYKQYKYDFIKSKNSLDGRFWKIVGEKIKSL